MSFIETVSLIFIVLSIIFVTEAYVRSGMYRKAKNTKTYSQIRNGLIATILTIPVLIYIMDTSSEEVLKNAILFGLICDAIVLMKNVPIVLKEEMKKLP